MNFLKTLGCAAALAFCATGTAQASLLMNDWVFNPNGGGFKAGMAINEYLDVNGNGFIQLKATSATSFTFSEHAVFNILQADSQGQMFPQTYPGGHISATLEAYGTGSFGGTFRFERGTIRMYQNPTAGQYGSTTGIYGANLGNQIAEFNVIVGGGGRVDAKGNPVSNGQVTVFAEAAPGMIRSGYFFDKHGNDLSTEWTGAFAFTNANTVGRPTSKLVSEVACEFAKYAGPGCKPSTTYKNVAGDHFFVGGGGQFKLAEVPEPGSVALFGIALAGIGAMCRRVKAA